MTGERRREREGGREGRRRRRRRRRPTSRAVSGTALTQRHRRRHHRQRPNALLHSCFAVVHGRRRQDSRSRASFTLSPSHRHSLVISRRVCPRHRCRCCRRRHRNAINSLAAGGLTAAVDPDSRSFSCSISRCYTTTTAAVYDSRYLLAFSHSLWQSPLQSWEARRVNERPKERRDDLSVFCDDRGRPLSLKSLAHTTTTATTPPTTEDRRVSSSQVSSSVFLALRSPAMLSTSFPHSQAQLRLTKTVISSCLLRQTTDAMSGPVLHTFTGVIVGRKERKENRVLLGISVPVPVRRLCCVCRR